MSLAGRQFKFRVTVKPELFGWLRAESLALQATVDSSLPVRVPAKPRAGRRHLQQPACCRGRPACVRLRLGGHGHGGGHVSELSSWASPSQSGARTPAGPRRVLTRRGVCASDGFARGPTLNRAAPSMPVSPAVSRLGHTAGITPGLDHGPSLASDLSTYYGSGRQARKNLQVRSEIMIQLNRETVDSEVVWVL